MAEASVSLKHEEISALLLKAASGGRLSKEERRKLRGVCHFCGEEMIPNQNAPGDSCSSCGRNADVIFVF